MSSFLCKFLFFSMKTAKNDARKFNVNVIRMAHVMYHSRNLPSTVYTGNPRRETRTRINVNAALMVVITVRAASSFFICIFWSFQIGKFKS